MLNQVENSGRLVTKAAASRLLQLSRRALERQIREGYLQTVRHQGREYVRLPIGAQCAAAGAAMVDKEWNRPRIIRAIRSMLRDGEPLTHQNVERMYPHLFEVACSREQFGSWQAALIAAGVDGYF